MAETSDSNYIPRIDVHRRREEKRLLFFGTKTKGREFPRSITREKKNKKETEMRGEFSILGT